MASGLTGTEVPGNRLRVRVPCPPLSPWQQDAWFIGGKTNFSDGMVHIQKETYSPAWAWG
jgi:hypothetical protein